MNKRVTVAELTKAKDGQGGFALTPTTIHTVWASIELTGSGDDTIGDHIIRFDKYNVQMRRSPILDTPIAINKLMFTSDSGLVIYPKSFGIDGGMVIFECTDRHEG